MARARIISLIRGFLVTIFIALVFTSPAFAGSFDLHPAGFGPNSYAAWKAGEGLPDNTGNANHALYFQKFTTTLTNAAGVAVFKGFAGLPSSDLLGLKSWVGNDGHCGARAPRFNVLLQLTVGKEYFFAGCQTGSGMAPTLAPPMTAPNGRVFQQREVICYYPQFGVPPDTPPCIPLPPGTIVSIAIVFDEGNDVGQGFVYLDNIQVGTHIWTSASDNGNGDPIISDPTGADVIAGLLGEPLGILFP